MMPSCLKMKIRFFSVSEIKIHFCSHMKTTHQCICSVSSQLHTKQTNKKYMKCSISNGKTGRNFLNYFCSICVLIFHLQETKLLLYKGKNVLGLRPVTCIFDQQYFYFVNYEIIWLEMTSSKMEFYC